MCVWTPSPAAAAAAGDEAQLIADSAPASGKVISLPSNKTYIKVIEKENNKKKKRQCSHH